MKFLPAFLILFSALFLRAGEGNPFPGKWNAAKDGAQYEISSENGIYSALLQFPGGSLISKERERGSAGPERLFFQSGTLSFQVRASRITSPLKAWIFVKDKDGAWFQSAKEYRLEPGEWTNLEMRLDLSGRELYPIGHSAAWSGFYASRIFAAGLSLWSDETQEVLLEWKEPEFSGEREKKPLHIRGWELPGAGKAYEMIRSRFDLSREYFNPFDPDEIQVDFEVSPPDFPEKTETYPAFYSQAFRKNRHFTRETFSAEGLPFWEFRFIPKKAGTYRLRLVVQDRTENPQILLRSEWREIRVVSSDHPGFIRVNRKDPHYFEYENGGFFFPVGINIHSNTDLRSERAFRFGHLADRGNADYEEYIRSCSAAGMNVMEIWMAAWTFAIEWSSCRPGFYGTGFYHLGNAAKLDSLLDYALAHKMNISLVLDNHGKLTETCDPEWHEHPYNAKSFFAKADSGFLQNPSEFWTDPKAFRANEKRNRYIAARWGAYPNIFAFQLWSEVDLVSDAYPLKENKLMAQWHRKNALFMKRSTQGKQLVSTHVCGEVGNLMHWKSVVVDPPELDHACCDAYRKYTIPIVHQLQLHYDSIKEIPKPVMITEYGRTSPYMVRSTAAADVHGGIWSSLFTRHAGTPWLWWHDFIHRNNLYPHYLGFSKFLNGMDLAKGRAVFGSIDLSARIVLPAGKSKYIRSIWRRFRSGKVKQDLPFQILSGLFLNQNNEFLCGWIYRMEYLAELPMDPEERLLVSGIKAKIRTKLKKGCYLIQYYDTISNELIASSLFLHYGGGYLSLDVPDLNLDCAFKLYRIGGLR